MLWRAITIGCVLIASPSLAWGNAAEPTSYRLEATGEGVRVCPRNFDQRGCGDADGMLRENVKTGEVVKLTDDCSEREGDAACYVDACVPAGTYRYGFAKPYTCNTSSASTDYWDDVTVTEGCSGEATQHAVFTEALPWKGKDQRICSYRGDKGGGDNGCGHCTIDAPSSRVAPAVGAFAAGLLLLRRRRR